MYAGAVVAWHQNSEDASGLDLAHIAAVRPESVHTPYLHPLALAEMHSSCHPTIATELTSSNRSRRSHPKILDSILDNNPWS